VSLAGILYGLAESRMYRPLEVVDMWLETRQGLINTEHAAKIVTAKNLIYIYRPETPKTGNIHTDPHRDVIGDIRCEDEDAAKALYSKIMADLQSEKSNPL